MPDNDDLLVTFGGAVKALGDGKIGGYLVKFTDAAHADLEGEYFDARTDYDFEDGRKTSVYLNHRQPMRTGKGGSVVEREKIGEGTLKRVDDGVLIEAVLYNAKQYEALLSMLGWSSGTAPHLVEYDDAEPGKAVHIARWPLGLDASITPTPANPYGSRVVPMKSLITAAQAETAPEPEATPEASNRGEAVKAQPDVRPKQQTKSSGGVTMPEEQVTNTTQTLDVAAIAKAAADEAVKAYRASLENEPPVKSAGRVLEDEADNANKKNPFKSMGEFLMAVKDASHSSKPDQRLLSISSVDGYDVGGALGQKAVGGFKSYKQTGLNEGNNALGGFLVGTDEAPGILERVYAVGDLLRRVDMVTVSPGSNGMTFNAVNETARTNGNRKGGIRAYWTAEGGTKQASYPAFREMELRLHKVAALVYATDELLQDATALESWIVRNLPEELRFVVEDAIINGTGAGMPLGLLPSITPAGCVISVGAEVGQAAATIVHENILNMWGRMYAPSRRNAVWLINQDVETQLNRMALGVGTGGLPSYLPPGGLSAAPYGLLMGRPVLPVEYCQTLGTQGDIILADLSEYQMIEKGGVQSASSIHVNFVYDETVFRFVYRTDGQPKWNLDLTPFNGTNTLSPFVVLDTRS